MGTDVIVNKERSAYWDNIKGLLILLVVFAHILYKLQLSSAGIDAVVDYIYLFHMPAFVFVSGYFGRDEKSHSSEKIIRLVFLFFIFNSITAFIESHTSLLEPIYSYWYLLALIFWRLTAHRIAKLKWINIVLFAASFIIGFFPAIDNHFATARIIGFYPFYMLGYQLSDEKNSKLMAKKYSVRAATGGSILVVTAAVAFAARALFEYSVSALKIESYTRPMDMFGRIAMFIIAFLVILAIRYIMPDRKIPLITMFGRNSLWIFVLHRLPTLWLSDCIADFPTPYIIAVAVLSAVVLCVGFGNDIISGLMNKFLDSGAAIFNSNSKKITLAKVLTVLVALGFVVTAAVNSYLMVIPAATEETEVPDSDPAEDILYPVMSDYEKHSLDNAFRITFAGDLILLEDQVNRGYTENGYDYSDVFEYAKPYIESADLAIGVFEGPMAGEDKGYSTSNYDDGKELYLNFPDEFAQAVKNAGFDLVTTANNHMLDKGVDGASRTLDVLDKAGLDHTGTYRNQDEKDRNHIKIIEKDGIRIAVLAYTNGSNYIPTSQIIDGQYSYVSSVISRTSGEQFEKLKASVEEDFRQAKALDPDLIIVLPHIGTQFLNYPDAEQNVWFSIFKENGADIILGDHPHVVEPVEIETIDGRTVFTAYCPGNFANVYREHQGDTSMLIDVYIDRDSKEVIGGSIVPLYTYAPLDGNYKAVPIYEIMNNPSVRSELTADDLVRAANAHSIVTEVVFGHKMDITSVTERYYIKENGFVRAKNRELEIDDSIRSSSLYLAMAEVDSICFIGDSVTEGTKNGGCPWYEPIEAFFPDKTINNYSKGSCTVSYMLDHINEIPAADLYVIAIGTNDVRYRMDSACAMTSDEYINRLNELKNKLLEKSSDAEFVFIAPWYSTDGDPYCPMTFAEKTKLNEDYSNALKKYCISNNSIFINANDYIRDAIRNTPDKKYLLDHIHPNSSAGVVMYSRAVLMSGKG